MVSDNFGNVDLLEFVDGMWSVIPTYRTLLKNMKHPITEMAVLKRSCKSDPKFHKYLDNTTIVALGSSERITVLSVFPKKILYKFNRPKKYVKNSCLTSLSFGYGSVKNNEN